MDISNSNSAVCLIDRPKLESFETGTDLFTAKQRSIKVKAKDKPSPLANISFPMRLEPNDRSLLDVEIELDMKTDDLKALARELSSLDSYALEVIFPYSFKGAEKKEKLERLQGSYAGFTEEVLKFWRSRKLYELISISDGIQT